jgi:hypothetical protein
VARGRGIAVLRISAYLRRYVVLGDSFVSYLAAACGVSLREMEAVFEEERAGRETLVPFLKERFVHSRLYDEKRLGKLERYLKLVEPRP